MILQKKIRKTREDAKKGDRILIFDLLRIICVAIIVYVHSQYDLIPWINKFFFPDGYGPLNIYSAGLQGYAVYGMIFVSGAVLEYNYRGLEQVSEYAKFIFKRFIRIYPAFWMSLILGILLFPAVLQNNIWELLFEFTGFFVILGKGPGLINIMGWFIAAITSLYLLFPFFSRLIRKYKLCALIGFCIISWGLRVVISTTNLIPLNLFTYWFPLCNAFEFCLGIYIVQNKWFPSKKNIYPDIRKLADLCFYIFLFHIIIIHIFVLDVQPLMTFDKWISGDNPYIGYTIYYFQMLATILVVSLIAMEIDKKIQMWILQRESVKKILST